MGEVEHDAEANFPRAVFHLERRARCSSAFGAAPGESQPWRWHTRILLSLANAYGEIEQHEGSWPCSRATTSCTSRTTWPSAPGR